jgi:50S ribosomal protein L16 3-hydroxylase
MRLREQYLLAIALCPQPLRLLWHRLLSMLDEWLSPMPVSSFVLQFLRKRPYASPSSAHGAVQIFQWATLEEFLQLCMGADILVVARGKLLDLPVPRSLAALRVLLAAGVGLVIRRAEHHDPALAKFALSLSNLIPGEVHVQLFITPAGTHGFGWHYDDEDVFILQTSGTKDYFFRDNTVERNRPPHSVPDFTRFPGETSPIGTTRLIPGDWLYIPSRWWHMAKCTDDSLSVSFGISVDDSWLADIARSKASANPNGSAFRPR